jgi:hypothetical protein
MSVSRHHKIAVLNPILPTRLPNIRIAGGSRTVVIDNGH